MYWHVQWGILSSLSVEISFFRTYGEENVIPFKMRGFHPLISFNKYIEYKNPGN